MISVRFQGKPFNITVIQVYAPTSNAEEAEVEWFYKDLQDLLELTPKKDVLFLTGDWNAKVGNQEIPGVMGKFGLGIWKEAGQRLIEFCQENTLVIAKASSNNISQCKELEENNRMGKTRDLFKKIRDTKGIFHAKIGSIKDRNGMDLTEAEDIKKRWQEYTELYKKGLHKTDNHDGVITHLEPDILECEVKWALEASLQTKLLEVMEFQLSYFKS